MYMLPSKVFQGHHLCVLPTSNTYVEWTVSNITPDHNSLSAIPLKPIVEVVCDRIFAYHLPKCFHRLKYMSLLLDQLLPYAKLTIITSCIPEHGHTLSFTLFQSAHPFLLFPSLHRFSATCSSPASSSYVASSSPASSDATDISSSSDISIVSLPRSLLAGSSPPSTPNDLQLLHTNI